MLKSKVVMIDDTKYEVREITIGEVMPILPRLNNEDEAQEAQMDIMKLCIVKDDKPMCEDVLNLGIASYLKLAEEVMLINGLSEVGKDSTPTE